MTLCSHMLLTNTVSAQEVGIVSGIASTITGEPLENLTISVLGQEISATTDSLGAFCLRYVLSGRQKLIVRRSFYGLDTTAIQVYPNKETNVLLSLPNAIMLADSIVVLSDRSSPAVHEIKDVFEIKNDYMYSFFSNKKIGSHIIEDRQFLDLNSVSENVAGIQVETPYTGNESDVLSLRIRGFAQSFPFLGNMRDGFREVGFIAPRSVTSLERVEYIKGISSVLYGSTSSFGGTANTVSKVALPDRHARINLSYGNNSQAQGTVDYNNKLNSEGKILYRSGYSFKKEDSFRNFVSSRNNAFFSAVRWVKSSRDFVDFNIEYVRNRYNNDYYFPADEKFLKTPVSRYFGEPDIDDVRVSSFSTRVTAHHWLSENWRSRVRFGFSETFMNSSQISFFSLRENSSILDRYLNSSDEYSSSFNAHFELSGQFESLGLKHIVVSGIDHSRFDFDWSFVTADYNTIDIENPQYGSSAAHLDPSTVPGNSLKGVQSGFYLLDRILIGSKLVGLWGSRLEYQKRFNRTRNSGELLSENNALYVSPLVGLMYFPIQKVTTYITYTSSVSPQLHDPAMEESAFKPEEGRQTEIGIRTEVLDSRIFLGATYFVISKRNVLATDPDAPTEYAWRRIATGRQKSAGLELEMRAKLHTGLEFDCTYSYTHASIVEDTMLQKGETLIGVPKNSANCWMTQSYDYKGSRRMRIGLGGIAASEQQATLPNSFKLPPYLRLDAMVNYSWNRYKFQANIFNLTDSRDYTPQYGLFIVPRPKRSLRVSLFIDF